MRHDRSLPAFFNPWLAWYPAALGVTQMMRDSAEVISLRTNRMMKAGATPGIGDRVEIMRMGHEKVLAATESGASMMQSLFALNGRLWLAGIHQMVAGVPMLLSLAASTTPAQVFARQAAIANAVWNHSIGAQARSMAEIPHIARKGLKPVQSRASANVRRLRPR